MISKYLLNITMGQAHSRGDQGPNRASPLWRQCDNEVWVHNSSNYSQGDMADARGAIQVMVPEALRIQAGEDEVPG